MSVSDDLVRRCLDRDELAWRELVSAVYPQIRRFLVSKTHDEDLADDLAQELFLKLVRDEMRVLRAYDPAYRIPLEQYLRVVAYRLFLDWTRSKAARRSRVCVDLSQLAEVLASPDLSDGTLLARELSERLDRLPPRQRSVVRLRLEGLDYEGIGRLLGITRGGVGALLHRARARLLEE
ncbi:MAG: sigma-70 family RNA polymerase sigma factor [Candidatus Eisenbacteria bacterium]|nr:sigma-70 family RNA polymerase sigma factor [Candidatus Eisenbacteria bacterium]